MAFRFPQCCATNEVSISKIFASFHREILYPFSKTFASLYYQVRVFLLSLFPFLNILYEQNPALFVLYMWLLSLNVSKIHSRLCMC